MSEQEYLDLERTAFESILIELYESYNLQNRIKDIKNKKLKLSNLINTIKIKLIVNFNITHLTNELVESHSEWKNFYLDDVSNNNCVDHSKYFTYNCVKALDKPFALLIKKLSNRGLKIKKNLIIDWSIKNIEYTCNFKNEIDKNKAKKVIIDYVDKFLEKDINFIKNILNESLDEQQQLTNNF